MLILCSLVSANGQNSSDIGSITVVRCEGCGDIRVEPAVAYPAHLGYGPHKYSGEISVSIVINEEGVVTSAKAISGHPYFRPLLEKASLTIRTRPIATKKEAVVVYAIRHSVEILNGRASSLPKPRYPPAARKYCADGKVEVEVTFNRAGRVINALARTGDELLTQAAVIAAKRARFRTVHAQPARTVGILVYTFKCPWLCITVTVPVNKRAISIPKPQLESKFHPDPLQIVEDETSVDVAIVVSPDGSVISTRTRERHPLIRSALIKSAAGAIFSPTPSSRPVYVRAFLRYTVKRSGEVTY